MNNSWKNLSPLQKVCNIIIYIICGIFLILLGLKGAKVINFPFNITYPAIFLVSALEIVQFWKSNRKSAYLSIAFAVVFLVLTVVDFVIN